MQNYKIEAIDLSQIEPADLDIVTKREASHMVNSISQFGLLHDPAVYPEGVWPDGTTRYRVIIGKRRLANLKTMQAETVTCRVYESVEPATLHLMRISENYQRTPNWRDQIFDIIALREIDSSIGYPELAKLLKVSQGALKELIALSYLEESFLTEIREKRINKGLALALTKLNTGSRERLAQELQSGQLEKLDREIVRQANQVKQLNMFGEADETVPVARPQAVIMDGLDPLAKLTELESFLTNQPASPQVREALFSLNILKAQLSEILVTK